MSGMSNTGDANVSSYGSRTVAIEVTGVCRQDIMKTANYTIKVPHYRRSQAMQNIHRMGAKVANITLLPKTEAATKSSKRRSKRRSKN